MSPRCRPFLVVPLLLLAAGCDPRIVQTSSLTPREVQTLAGTWEGQGSLRFGAKECPSYYLWTLRVSGGTVEGDLVDKDTPNAPRTTFSTFLDYDGTIHGFARPGGRDTNVRGAFGRDHFTGESKSKECIYALRLRRAPGS